MLKFKYHYLHNTLAYHKEADIWLEIPEARTFQGNFGSQGFQLDNGWISFTVYEQRIRAFYKAIEASDWVNYYRKDLPLKCPVIFTFATTDEVEKIAGKWQKKGDNQ